MVTSGWLRGALAWSVLGAVAIFALMLGLSFRSAVGQGGPSPQSTIVVDGVGGNSGGACLDTRSIQEAQSPATPLCTLTQALAIAPSGSRIWLRGGDYPALAASGPDSRADFVSVASYPGEQAALPGVTVTRGAGYLRLERLAIGAQGVRIEEGGSHHIAVVDSEITSAGSDAILVLWGSRDITLERNVIRSTRGNGITLNSQSSFPGVPDPSSPLPPITNVIIRNNRLDGIGTDAIRPANFENLLIEGNEITGVVENNDDHSDALQVVWGGRNLVFRGNYVHDNTGQGFFIKDGEVTGVTVENNVFARNRLGYQIAIYETVGLKLLNNTVTGNELDGSLGENVRDVVVRNNIIDDFIIDGNPGRLTAEVKQDYNVIPRGHNWGARGSHDVKTPARFVDPARGDYRLAAGSPGIDAGTSDGAPVRDKACRPRVDAAGVTNRGGGGITFYDIGAHEFGPESTAGDTRAPYEAICAGYAADPSTATGPPAAAGGGRSPGARPPKLVLRRHRLARRSVVLYVRADEDAAVTASGRARWNPRGARRLRSAALRTARRRLVAGKTTKLTLRLPIRARAAIRRKRPVTLDLRLVATDSQGDKGRLSRRLAVRR